MRWTRTIRNETIHWTLNVKHNLFVISAFHFLKYNTWQIQGSYDGDSDFIVKVKTLLKKDNHDHLYFTTGGNEAKIQMFGVVSELKNIFENIALKL